MTASKRIVCLAVCLVAFGTAAAAQDVSEFLGELNDELLAQGSNVLIHRAEYIVEPESGEIQGRTVFADDRTLTLGTRWVAGDARRLADGDRLNYLIDQSFALANGSIPIDGPIDASFDTWDEDTQCSNLPIDKRPDNPAVNPNFVLALFGLAAPGDGPPNPFAADITETGFLPGFVFDLIAPGGSNFILGVTFTLIFVDGNGNPTDVNEDGFLDTGLKEVWYNDAFIWTDTGTGGVDIESVALHENGHALELGHFGSIFRTDANGKLHVSPRAVMNAVFLGTLRELLGTDDGAHCTAFGDWPND